MNVPGKYLEKSLQVKKHYHTQKQVQAYMETGHIGKPMAKDTIQSSAWRQLVIHLEKWENWIPYLTPAVKINYEIKDLTVKISF